MARNAEHTTLGVISLGLALGITCALFTFLLGVAATLLGWGTSLAMVLSDLFVGFGPSFVGALTGTVWAFFDGFIAGALIAKLYNTFLLRRQSDLARRHRR